MRDFLREALGHLLIPACVAVVWFCGHMHSATPRNLTGTWWEEGTLRTGNPYTASVPRVSWPEADDATPTELAKVDAPGDARR